MYIKNLGPIKQLDLELNQHTIFLGENNLGKTYVSYLVYGIIKKFTEYEKEMRKNSVQRVVDKSYSTGHQSIEINSKEILSETIDRVVKKINKDIKDILPIIFNLPSSYFENTEVKVFIEDFNFIFNRYDSINKKGMYSLRSTRRSSGKVQVKEIQDGIQMFEVVEITSNLVSDEEVPQSESVFVSVDEDTDGSIIKSLLSGALNFMLFKRIFSMNETLYIPAERNGINVFKDELLTNRSNFTFDFFDVEESDLSLNLEDKSLTYPLPIADYMKYINTISTQLKSNVLIPKNKNHKNISIKNNRKVGEDFTGKVLKGEIKYDNKFENFYYEQINNEDMRIPIKSSSSSTKSLFGLNFYITSLYKPGDILFIDEPEMNLDPKNQIEFAKILLDLTKSGVEIIISTHSDYWVRKITNELLKDKLTGNDSKIVSTYYFSESGINKLQDLTDEDFISFFDNVGLALENEHLSLLDTIEENN